MVPVGYDVLTDINCIAKNETSIRLALPIKLTNDTFQALLFRKGLFFKELNQSLRPWRPQKLLGLHRTKNGAK